MYNILEVVLTVLGAVFASSGFWAYLIARRDKKRDIENKDNVTTRMILGLGHDRIIYLCEKYIDRGYVTSDEYENLREWLYEPYIEMGGNGTAKRLMSIVENLPTKEIKYTADGKRIESELEKRKK